MIKQYAAVLFDLSGTLLGYRPDYNEIYSGRINGIGIEVPSDKAERIAVAVNHRIGVEIQKEQDGGRHLTNAELQRALDEAALLSVCDHYTDEMLDRMGEIPYVKQEIYILEDVIPVLEYLKTKYRLGIVSNHKVWMKDYLVKCGLASYCETIIISDIVGIEKPDPGILRLALEELQLAPEDVLFVGDQIIDVICAKRAGVDCVRVLYDKSAKRDPEYKEDITVQKIGELKNLL